MGRAACLLQKCWRVGVLLCIGSMLRSAGLPFVNHCQPLADRPVGIAAGVRLRRL